MRMSTTRTIAGTIVAIAGITLAACSSSAPAAPPKPAATAPAQSAPAAAASGSVDAGKAAFQAKGCGACHTTKAVAGAAGTVGPNLDGLTSRAKIAGTLDMNADNLKKWLKNPPGVKPGTQMPNLSLSDAEIDNLTALLLSLK